MAYRERPLSPHLQVYRWQVQMVSSILHRGTGIILSLGSLLIAWGLVALAAGARHWHDFTDAARSPLGLLVLFGWTWALAFHLLSGLRHLSQDMGLGVSPPAFVKSAWTAIVGSLVLTAIIWLLAMQKWGGA
ncbi:succinate dehydrogenase, cytochrome b556 subunit [Lysobacter xanthus]